MKIQAEFIKVRFACIQTDCQTNSFCNGTIFSTIYVLTNSSNFKENLTEHLWACDAMFTQNCLTGNSQLVLTGVKIYAHIYCELLKLAVVNIPLTASDKYAVQITVCFPHFIDGSFRFLRVKCVESSDCVCNFRSCCCIATRRKTSQRYLKYIVAESLNGGCNLKLNINLYSYSIL